MDHEMKKQYQDLLGPDKDKMIVVYCGFVKCGRSHVGSETGLQECVLLFRRYLWLARGRVSGEVGELTHSAIFSGQQAADRVEYQKFQITSHND